METKRFTSVTDMLSAVGGDESLVSAVATRIASRRLVSTLVALRASADASQADVAKVLGCTQSRVSKIENGVDDDLTWKVIRAYAKVSKRDLCTWFPEKGATLMDHIKFHAFKIRECLDKVAALSEGDPLMEKAAVHSHIESLVNLSRLILESAANVSCIDEVLQEMCVTSEDECNHVMFCVGAPSQESTV